MDFYCIIKSLTGIYYGVGDFFINLVKKFSNDQPATGAGAAAGMGKTSGQIASRIPFGWFTYDLQVALVWVIIALIILAIIVSIHASIQYDERRQKSFEKNRKVLQRDHNRPR